MAKQNTNNNDKWVTPSSFQDMADKTMSFVIGNTNFTVSDMSFHIHKIDTHTKPHRHSNFQIIYYTKGNGTQHIGKSRYKVSPASVFFVPPGKNHKFIPQQKAIAQAFTLIFSIDYHEHDRKNDYISGDVSKLLRLLYQNKLESFKLNPGEMKLTQNYINKVQKELTAKTFGYLIAVKGYLLLLLRDFLQAGIREECDNSTLSRKQLIFLRSSDYIRKNSNGTISLRTIAKINHVSESYIQKIYKEYAGRSITQFIHESKIENAMHLLSTTDLPIKQIATECGISDRNYFTRTFRKVVGVTPRQYRENNP